MSIAQFVFYAKVGRMITWPMPSLTVHSQAATWLVEALEFQHPITYNRRKEYPSS